MVFTATIIITIITIDLDNYQSMIYKAIVTIIFIMIIVMSIIIIINPI